MKLSIFVGAVFLNAVAVNGAVLPPDSSFFSLSASEQRAFQLTGNAVLTSGCSVAVASTHATDAFHMEGQTRVNFGNHARAVVVGGWSLNGNQIRDTLDNVQIQPQSLSPVPADPLASVVLPTTGTIVSPNPVSYDMNNRPLNNTLNPGVYCGGLTIGNTNGATFTLNPGVYVIP